MAEHRVILHLDLNAFFSSVEQHANPELQVNERFGEFKVTFGSLVSDEEKGSHVISPAWRPEGIWNVDVK